MVRFAGLGLWAGLMVLGCGKIVQAQPSVMPIAQATQQQTGEIERAIEEGTRLFKEGGVESLRKAIGLEQTAITLPPIEQLPQLMEDLFRQGKYNQAAEILEHFLAYCKKTENLGCQAAMLNDLGRTYAVKGNYFQALDYYQEALKVIQKIKSPLLSLLLQNMGLTYFKLNDYQQSLKYYRNALQHADNIQDTAFSLLGIGRQYEALGNYSEALVQYQKLLEIAQESNSVIFRSVALANIASLYTALKQYDQAIEIYKKSLQITNFSDSPTGYSNILNNLGLAYYLNGDYDQALPILQEALKISNDFKDFDNTVFRKITIAQLYIKKGDFNSAIRYFESVLDFSKKIGRREVSMIAYENLGNVYRDLKKYDVSLNYFLQQLNQSTSPNDIVLALNQIAHIHELKKRPELAVAFYKQSVNILESLRDNLKFLSRNEQSLYTQKIAETYHDLADLLIQQGRLSEAQQVVELLKIRELKELESNKAESKRSIQQLPISESEKQEIAKVNPEAAKEIQSQALPTIDRLSQNPLNQSAQALLSNQPNSALIYQFFTADKLWIILITPDGKLQRFSSNQTKAQLETLTQSIRSQLEKCERSTCDASDTQTLNQTTQKLYEQLFPTDLKTALTQTKHLTFALDGSLRNIPIAALHTGQQYLIEKYTLSSIIAAQLTDSQDKIPSNAQDSPILALGTSQSARLEVPDFIKADRQDRFAALGNVPLELNAILRSDRNPKAFPGKQLLNDQFTLPNIQQQLPKHRILHIASHGIFRPNSLDYSYILLGNQKRWSIAALDQDAQLFQNLHLITLSACQTGLSDRDKNGMEIAGMSHAFLSKGAKAINASLWSIDDESTALLMQQFYQNLTQNQSKAQALQTAQLHLLRTPRSQLITELSRSTDTRLTFESTNTPTPSTPKTRDYTHPYYWAAFTLIGNSL
jgi:CHAT domain-containing protein/Flp pilus assembly protein TadD